MKRAKPYIDHCPQDRWQFKNQGDSKAEVLIYRDIGDGYYDGLTAKDFIEQLDALGEITELSVRINSIGGSVFEGIAIYNALARHQAKIVVHVDGMAASIASVIAMAADPGELHVADNARMMIHNAWTIEIGDKQVMRKMADRLESLDTLIADTYAKRGKVDRTEIARMMNEETWFTAEEAVAAGLADAVEDEASIAAMSFDLSRFKNAPADLPRTAPNPRIEAVEQASNEAERVAVRMNLLDLHQENVII